MRRVFDNSRNASVIIRRLKPQQQAETSGYRVVAFYETQNTIRLRK